MNNLKDLDFGKQLKRLDKETTNLLRALYDATDTSDPEDLQAWFDERVGGTDERYDGMIHRLRRLLRELHRVNY